MGLEFDSIEPQLASWLERAFEEDEVYQVVRKMEKDKAPGLDGFSMGVLSNVLGGCERGHHECFQGIFLHWEI